MSTAAAAPATVLMSAAPKLATEPPQALGPFANESDSRLVQECLDGNEEAWAALIDKYKRLIYSIPLKYNLDRDSAADIFQAVCVELFCELRKVRKVESLKSWLITVTGRKCLHWKRERSGEVDLEDENVSEPAATTISAPALLEEAEKEQSLRDAIAALPARCREMIHLLFYQNPPLPYTGVAQRLGLATGSIGFIRGRCLDKLQKLLLEMGF